MERRFVRIEKGLGPQGRIAVVHFDRGDNINALSQQAMRELRDVPRDFEDDLETSVVVLTGSANLSLAAFEGRQHELHVAFDGESAWQLFDGLIGSLRWAVTSPDGAKTKTSSTSSRYVGMSVWPCTIRKSCEKSFRGRSV